MNYSLRMERDFSEIDEVCSIKVVYVMKVIVSL